MSTFQEMATRFGGQHNHRMRKLVDPIFQAYGINYFVYMFFSNSRELSYIGTNLELIQHYIDEKMHAYNPFFVHPDKLQTGIYLYDSFQHSEFQSSMQLLEKKHNARHICLMTRRDPEGCHVYAFAVPPEQTKHKSLLINHSNSLKQFCSYFNTEMEEILNKMKEQPVDLRKELDPFVTTSLIDSIPVIDLDQSTKIKLLKNISKNKFLDFTDREYDVIQEFLKGKTAKEIGLTLFLSRRTIEHYIEVLKEKLECRNRSELFEKLQGLKRWEFLPDL